MAHIRSVSEDDFQSLRRAFLLRADPHAHLHHRRRPNATRGRFVSLRRAISEFQADVRPTKRLAITFVGGGARGPYEGGAVEALVQELRDAGVAPDVVCGASVGSINALFLFVDTMFPQAAPNPQTHFHARQSSIWRDIAVGNDGASKVLDKAWLVEYVTGKKPIPGLGQLQDAYLELGNAWDKAQKDLGGLGPNARALLNALTSADPSGLFRDIGSAAATIVGDGTSILASYSAALNAANQLDPLDLTHLPDQALALRNAVTALVNTLSNLGSDIVQTGARLNADAVQTLQPYVNSVVGAAVTLAGSVVAFASDTGRLTGDLATLAVWIGVMLAIAFWIITHLETLFIAAGAFVLLADHVFDNRQISRVMDGLVRSSMAAANAAPPGAIVENWNSQKRAGATLPAIYLAATDLNARLMMVFALDDRLRLDRIASEGTWIVDLADQDHGNSGSENLFVPQMTSEDGDLLIRACLTSGALPFVLPPIKWTLKATIASLAVEVSSV
jgi:patatin-like phospholipase